MIKTSESCQKYSESGIREDSSVRGLRTRLTLPHDLPRCHDTCLAINLLVRRNLTFGTTGVDAVRCSESARSSLTSSRTSPGAITNGHSAYYAVTRHLDAHNMVTQSGGDCGELHIPSVLPPEESAVVAVRDFCICGRETTILHKWGWRARPRRKQPSPVPQLTQS